MMDIFEAIKENIEVDTVALTLDARKIRQETETTLKDLEERYKYVSHDVDTMIYQLEPIIAMLSVGEFNQVLCGTGLGSNKFKLIEFISRVPC